MRASGVQLPSPRVDLISDEGQGGAAVQLAAIAAFKECLHPVDRLGGWHLVDVGDTDVHVERDAGRRRHEDFAICALTGSQASWKNGEFSSTSMTAPLQQVAQQLPVRSSKIARPTLIALTV